MRKFKIGTSFWCLIIVCVIFNQFVLLLNYLIALALHELTHLLVATRRGYSLKLIKLDMFGLSLELGEQIEAEDVFSINLAGPLCNLLISLLCVACYWLFPTSFTILNIFCVANLMLALFNLLPICPLDGEKLMSVLIKNEKVCKKIESVIRYVLAILFLGLFIISIPKGLNLFMLLMSSFFLFSKPKQTPTLSLFKYTKPKNIEKVVLVKVREDTNLFVLIKQIKQHHYTIFYYKNERNNYIDQDSIIDKATQYPLTTTIKEIF